MTKCSQLLLVSAICMMFAVASFAQNTLPAGPGATQTPTYDNGTAADTGGVNKWGTVPVPDSALGMAQDEGFAYTDGQQFNSKWNMISGMHDLTTYTAGTKTTAWTGGTVAASRICSFCHTAHDNEGTDDRTFLWEHEVPATFGTPYGSPTLQSTPSTTAESVTAKCLGCHDGTIAVTSGNYGTPNPADNREFSVNTVALTSGGKLLASTGLLVPLSRTHPVSFDYDATLAAKHQLRVPADTNSVDGFGIIPLFYGKMECATCHDPHLKTGILKRQFPTGASQDAGTGSFCLYCHL